MTVINIKLFLGAIFCVITLHTVAAQTVEDVMSGCGGPSSLPCSNLPIRSSGDELRRHGIDLSRASVIAALSNSDAYVRWLAAGKLLEDGDRQAVPMIKAALSTETDNKAKVNIASALMFFGDPVGVRYLEAMCLDASLPVHVTAEVADQLGGEQNAVQAEAALRPAPPQASLPLPASPGKCADVLLAAFDRAANPSDRSEAVLAFPHIYRDVPLSKASRMIADAESLLTDADPSTRMAAANTLVAMRSSSSVSRVRNAMLQEQDPMVRSALKTELEILEKLTLASPATSLQ